LTFQNEKQNRLSVATRRIVRETASFQCLWKQIEEALDQVRFLVIVMTPAAMQSEMTRKEWRYVRQRGINVYPVKGCREDELDYASLPNWMSLAESAPQAISCRRQANLRSADHHSPA
jgi:hypothetical protein